VKDISTVKIPTPEIKDNDRVRMGVTSPPFPSARPQPENIGDDRKVRLGETSPMFPPLRSR
jgi:hypothetical protein